MGSTGRAADGRGVTLAAHGYGDHLRRADVLLRRARGRARVAGSPGRATTRRSSSGVSRSTRFPTSTWSARSSCRSCSTSSGTGFLFGWAKPTPVNPGNYRDTVWGDIRVSLGGDRGEPGARGHLGRGDGRAAQGRDDARVGVHSHPRTSIDLSGAELRALHQPHPGLLQPDPDSPARRVARRGARAAGHLGEAAIPGCSGSTGS